MSLADKSDSGLLERFHSEADEPAFNLLVERHLRIVFAVAQNRLGGDSQLAEDVCQIVFIELARKAKSLRHHGNVKAWLFKTSRFTAAKMARSRSRQSAKEQRYQRMSEHTADPTTPDEIETLKELIDESMVQLPPTDQEAVLLRYFESMDYKSIGKRLGLEPNTARMKVTRALDKLQVHFQERGITTSATALGAALNGYASCTLPAQLATNIAAASLASTSGLASVSLVSALKLPLIATAATILAGFAFEKAEPTELEDSVPEVNPTHANPAETSPITNPKASRAMDDIDIAYAALDNDASVLAQRLREVESQIQALHNRKAQNEKVYSISELDTKPRATAMMMPDYPIAHQATQEKGSAIIEFILGEDGKTSNLKIIDASHPDFGENALKAIAKSEFSPGRIGSTAVQSRVRIPIVFTPKRGEGQPETQSWF